MSHPCNNQCQSHCTSCVPSPCHHPQHGSPRLVNSSRPPRAPEVIGDLATSPRMILSLFLLSAFFLGSPTSALLFSIQQRTKSWLRPFIFILFSNEIWSPLFRLKSRWRTPTSTYEETGTFNHCKMRRQRDIKYKTLQALFEDHTGCAYSNDDHSKMTASSSV